MCLGRVKIPCPGNRVWKPHQCVAVYLGGHSRRDGSDAGTSDSSVMGAIMIFTNPESGVLQRLSLFVTL